MDFRKLVIVGTVATACLVASAFFSTSSVSSGTSLFTGKDSEVEQAFVQFIAKYGRSYASKSEIPKRFKVFAKNYAMVKAHNSKPDALYTMEMNRFSDMTDEDFKAEFGMIPDIDLAEVDKFEYEHLL